MRIMTEEALRMDMRLPALARERAGSGRRRFRSTRELYQPERARRDTVHVPLTQPTANPATSATRSMSHTI